MRKPVLFLVLSAQTLAVSSLAAQQRVGAPPAPSDLEITIEQPYDWTPLGSKTATRGSGMVANQSVRVMGTARHPQGVSMVWLNNKQITPDQQPDGSARFVGYVTIKPNMKAVEVAVTTRGGARIVVPYAVTPLPPPPPEASPQAALAKATGEFKGQRWALVVGISEYVDPEIQPLKYAARDAKSFYEFLRSDISGGFDPKNVRVLLNSEATYENIRGALRSFLREASEEDIVYVYYAGHGAPDPNRPDEMYLLPFNAQSKNLAASALAMDELTRAFQDVKAFRKVLITDACHSGAINAQGTRALENNQVNARFLDAVGNSVANVSFAASKANQVSREGEEWGGGHGAFTYYLLDGLQGAADTDKDLVVSLDEMIEYTREQVRRATGNSQTPMESATAYDGGFPMSMVLPGYKIPEISLAEIAEYQVLTDAYSSALASQWITKDSMLVIADVPDTVTITMSNGKNDRLPPRLLRWTSSNSSVLLVDQEGVLTPLRAGNARVTASMGKKEISVPIQVLPRPIEVVFRPAGNTKTLVISEEMQIRTDLLIGPSQWQRDMLPTRILVSDTMVLRGDGTGTYQGVRAGEAKVSATIANQPHEWTVRVVPPGVKIQRPRLAMPIGDSVALTAIRTRPDGSRLGDAANVTWNTSDTSRAKVRNGVLRAAGVGRVQIQAFLGSAEDTATVFVLGDLIVSIKDKNGPGLMSVSLASGAQTPLLPKGTPAKQAALSPAGDRIVYVNDRRIFIMDTDGQNAKQLTPSEGGNHYEVTPVWTHDGSRVLFISNAMGGNYEVLSIKADGTDLKRVTEDRAQNKNIASAPNGARIAFERPVSTDDTDLVLALPDGSSEMVFGGKTTASAARTMEVEPKFFPDGKELAFIFRLPGNDGDALRVMNLATGQVVREIVKAAKGRRLIYTISPDGNYIAYHSIDDGSKDGSIILIDKSGLVLRTIPLGAGIEISDITWGAAPNTPMEVK